MDTPQYHLQDTKNNIKRVPMLVAMAKGKCARCRKGNLFKGPFTSNTNEVCSSCGLTIERNPGYFYTSMFVSYAMNVAEIATLWIATSVLSGDSNDPWLYLSVIIPGLLLMAPFNNRYSKVIQVYWLDPGLKYRPELADTFSKERKEDESELKEAVSEP